MSVANTYARALYEAAAESGMGPQDMDRLAADIEQFDKLISDSKELRVVLQGPVTSSREKEGLVEALCRKMGAAPLLSNFMMLLARKNRMTAIDGIHEAFHTIRLSGEGAIKGQLTSADPIDAAEIAELEKVFGKKLGKRVAFAVDTDASLLAGLKVNVNGVTYDGTLRSQLQRLRDQLIN